MGILVPLHAAATCLLLGGNQRASRCGLLHGGFERVGCLNAASLAEPIGKQSSGRPLSSQDLDSLF